MSDRGSPTSTRSAEHEWSTSRRRSRRTVGPSPGAKVFMAPDTTSLVANREAISKGDVLAVARVAGIQAAKRTPDLIPLCHPLLVGCVLDQLPRSSDDLRRGRGPGRDHRPHRRRDGGAARPVRSPRSPSTTCASRSTARMVIGELTLWEKTGGRSGQWPASPTWTRST